jgi:two-component system, sensor histidine kinase PdtaS
MKKAALFLFFSFISQVIFGSNQDLALQLEKAKKLKIAHKMEEAKLLLLEGLVKAQEEGNEAFKGKFQLALADQLLSMNQVDSIDFFYQNAATIFEKVGNKADLLRAKTGLLELQRRTNPGSTMDLYLQLLKDAREFGDKEVYYFVMDKLITLNYAMENYVDAIALNRECIQYYKSTKDSLALAIKLKGLGNLYFTLNKDSARYYFDKALRYFEKLHSYSNMVITYQSKGWLLYLQGKNEMAWNELLKADSIDKHYRIQAPQLPFVMSLVLFKRGEVQEAILQAKKSYELGLKTRQLFICIQCADALKDYYKSLNGIDSALHYFEVSKMINDSIRSQRDYRNAIKMQAKLEYDREVFERELVQKEEIRREKLIRNFSLGGFVLVVIFLVAGWFAFKNNQKKSVLISKQNDEKTILLQEIHHRVKNNLSVVTGILDLQQRGLKDPEIQNVFTDAKLRINSMVLVHQNLYEQDDFTNIDTQNYFQNLATTIYQTYKKSDLDIEIEVNCKDVSISIDTLIPLALISNELLTNSFKYAFLGRSYGKIWIQLEEHEQGYRFIYGDNGVGISKLNGSEKKVGLGSNLIAGLSKQLNGNFNLSNQGEGLKYEFSFRGI